MKSIREIASALHELNFNKQNGIICPSPVHGGSIPASEYCYTDLKPVGDMREHDYTENGFSICRECRDIKPLLNQGGDNFRFTNITHGTHTMDFLLAHGKTEKDIEAWSKMPVLFVMENPGPYTKSCREVKIDGETRYPCTWWYWINGQGRKRYKKCKFIYPDWFAKDGYGFLVYSIINSFKIANGYVTNLVKCGIGCEDKKFKTINFYNPKIVDCCVERYLLKEAEILRGEREKVIVFAFGRNVYDKLCKSLNKENKDIYQIVMLPHPSGQSGISDEHRKYVTVGKIMNALLINGFYAEGEKPNFEDILLNDREDNTIEKLLLEFGRENGIDFVKDANYEKGVYGYTVKYSNGMYRLEIWYGLNDGEKVESNSKFNMMWCGYDFSSDEISLYINKKGAPKHCNLLVIERHADYKLFTTMMHFLKEKMDIDESDITIKDS